MTYSLRLCLPEATTQILTTQLLGQAAKADIGAPMAFVTENFDVDKTEAVRGLLSFDIITAKLAGPKEQ